MGFFRFLNCMRCWCLRARFVFSFVWNYASVVRDYFGGGCDRVSRFIATSCLNLEFDLYFWLQFRRFGGSASLLCRHWALTAIAFALLALIS